MAQPRPAQVDFFLSYTQADRPWAEWIAWVFEEAGFTTKIQAWDFRPGSNFVVEMQRASAGSKRTLAVLSPDYLQSLFGTAEWAAALAQDPTGEKGKLLPVRVREVDPDGLLAPLVYIDLVGLTEATARERLLAGLARGRAKPASKPVFPGDLPGGPRPRFPGEPLAPPDPAETTARLAELPLDDVPDPALLPPGSRMPLSANSLFVGRQDDLRALARSLKMGKTAAIGQIAAATGLGGIGKTQLACEFVHRYGRFFEGGVFWMSFADEAAVPAEVAACGRSLGLHPGYDGLPLDQQVRLVEEAWQSPLPRLLVFDNCEDPKLLDQRRPRSGGARVLVTSRRSRWDPALGVKVLALGTLERTASLQLLHRFRRDVPAEEPALNGIADELGDLPLALHLAGSFLARYRDAPFGQPEAYLEQLRRGDLLAHPSLQGKGAEISPTGHEAHVARTFALSYERLESTEPTDVLAQALLARAAHFACGELIPRYLLLATIQSDTQDLISSLQSEDALDRLVSLGLLEVNIGGGVVLHRLVASFVQSVDPRESARDAVEDAILAEANRLGKAGDVVGLLQLLGHLRYLTDEARIREDERAARLCNSLGFFLRLIRDSAGSQDYLEYTLGVVRRTRGFGHVDYAFVLHNLGSVLIPGDPLRAIQFLQLALGIRVKKLGWNDLLTPAILNNLASLFRVEGEYGLARRCSERALKILQSVAPDSSDTARTLNNLGGIVAMEGDDELERELYMRSLEVWGRIPGPEHPDKGRVLKNLGAWLYERGEISQARQHLERAREIFTARLGPDCEELKELNCLLAEVTPRS